MKVLREVNGICLNEGDGAARGLYNLSDDNDGNRLSAWFDTETKDKLMKMSDERFILKAEDFFQ
jgi:hypothetical protein